MALRKILIDGDPTLRMKSKPVTVFDNNLVELFKDMEETMEKANGAGISAVQVGVLKRAFVIVENKKNVWIVNPEILASRGKNKVVLEGCLSVPDRCGIVEIRPNEVDVRYQDINGKTVERTIVGFSAKAFCHEYDHLDGILYIDRASKMYDSYDDYYAERDKQKEKSNKQKKD